MTGINLEVVFFVGLQSTLLEAHARFLSLLKTHAIMMRKLRCSNVEVKDGRPGCCHDIEIVMTWMCLNNLIFKIKFVGHMLRSYD